MSETKLLRDDRADSFFQIGDLARDIAEIHCDIPIDTTTHQRWRELLGLLREFDTITDDTDISHEEALRHLAQFDSFSENYPALSPEQLPAHVRTRLLGRVAIILNIGNSLSETKDIDEFIALRVAEGRHTAEMISDCASPETGEHPGFETEFMPIMRSLGVTANLLDSLSDARRDYEAGKISIQPSKEFHLRLAKESYLYSRLGFRALYHGSIIKQFAIMSGTRLKNRIIHGVTPYSSLHNVTGSQMD